MAFFNRRVDPRLPDTVEWDTQIVEGATVAEFAELPARHGIRTTQIFNPDAVTCEIADDEYAPFTSLTRILSGNPTASEFYADGGSAYIFVHVDNLAKYVRATIYPGGTVITAERLASDEFKGATGATGAAGATGSTGATGPAGPSTEDAINAAADKTTPADADRIGFTDSAASYILKRFTFANLWTWVLGELSASGYASSVFGRTGAVTAQAGDYSAHYAALTSNLIPKSWGIIDGTLTGTNAPTYNAGISASVQRMVAGNYEVTLSSAVSNMMPQATCVTPNDGTGQYGGHAQCIVNSSTKFTIYCVEMRVSWGYVDANPIRFTVFGS